MQQPAGLRTLLFKRNTASQPPNAAQPATGPGHIWAPASAPPCPTCEAGQHAALQQRGAKHRAALCGVWVRRSAAWQRPVVPPKGDVPPAEHLRARGQGTQYLANWRGCMQVLLLEDWVARQHSSVIPQADQWPLHKQCSALLPDAPPCLRRACRRQAARRAAAKRCRAGPRHRAATAARWTLRLQGVPARKDCKLSCVWAAG